MQTVSVASYKAHLDIEESEMTPERGMMFAAIVAKMLVKKRCIADGAALDRAKLAELGEKLIENS